MAREKDGNGRRGRRERGRTRNRKRVKGRWSVAEPCLQEKQTPEKSPRNEQRKRQQIKEIGCWRCALFIVVTVSAMTSRFFFIFSILESSTWTELTRVRFIGGYNFYSNGECKKKRTKNRLIIVMLFVIFSTSNILIIMETIDEYMKITFATCVRKLMVVWLQSWFVHAIRKWIAINGKAA